MRANQKRKAVKRTLEEYASRTSIHGISYIFDRDFSCLERFLWTTVVLAFLVAAILFSFNLWIQWDEQQVSELNLYHNFARVAQREPSPPVCSTI